MPQADDKRAGENVLLRVLCYGPAQTKKTWWALNAAEEGFNILLLDGDGHTHVINHLSAAAKSRIQILNAGDAIDRPVFARVLAHVLKAKEPLLWDDDANHIVYRGPNMEHHHYYIMPQHLTYNDILVIDSWSALVVSIMWDMSITLGVDPADLDKIEWDGYGASGRFADWVLAKIKSLPCHVIVLGHTMVHEKRKGGKGPDKNDIIWSREQAISTSANHSKKLPKEFAETLVFSIMGNNMFKVDARSQDNRDSGSRVIPEIRDWDDFQFHHLATASKCRMPVLDAPMPGCTMYLPGQLPEELQNIGGSNLLLQSKGGTADVAVSEPKATGMFAIAQEKKE